MTQIIATSKAGVNVLTAIDPNDFIFHSNYNTLKIIATGIFNQAVPALTDEVYSFDHNLSYIPLVEGFCKVDAEDYVVCPYEGMDINTFPFYYYFYFIGADGSKVYVRLNNSSGSEHTFSIKYYIFEVPF